MIKVVEVIPTLSMGGAESMVRDYCLLIDRDRFDVSVIVLTEHKNTPIERALEERGINVIYIGELLYKNGNLSFTQRVVRRLSRYIFFRQVILDMKPDVIHLHLQIGIYMRMLPLKRMRCRLFLTVHNVPERFFSTDTRDGKKHREYIEVNRLVHAYNMTLISLHNGLNDELRTLFDTDKVITVYNGICRERFDPLLYDKKEEREKFGIGRDDIVIGHVGSMHPQKNHERILEVFYAFHTKYRNSKLILVGDGVLKNDIINRIDTMDLEDSIILLSNRNDVPQIMSTMDVFLFPSRWEGFGNVLIEAQCMGLPCVVSDRIPQEVRVTNSIHVVSLSESNEKWVSTILDAINGKEGALKKTELDNYDMRNVIKSLEQIYAQ